MIRAALFTILEWIKRSFNKQLWFIHFWILLGNQVVKFYVSVLVLSVSWEETLIWRTWLGSWKKKRKTELKVKRMPPRISAPASCASVPVCKHQWANASLALSPLVHVLPESSMLSDSVYRTIAIPCRIIFLSSALLLPSSWSLHAHHMLHSCAFSDHRVVGIVSAEQYLSLKFSWRILYIFSWIVSSFLLIAK